VAQEKEGSVGSSEDFPAEFKDGDGRDYRVEITVPVAYDFCKQNRLSLGQFLPGYLNAAQQIDLAFMSTRNTNHAKVIDTKAKFLELLEGPAFRDVIYAVEGALINFTLRTTPKENREETKGWYKMNFQEAQQATDLLHDDLQNKAGGGKTSGDSPESSE